MDSIDLEYAKVVAKHRQPDKGQRPTPIVFSPFSNSISPPNPGNNLFSSNQNIARKQSISDRVPHPSSTPMSSEHSSSPNFPFSPGMLNSNLSNSVSKLRRTSQFFSKLTHSLSKSQNKNNGRIDRGVRSSVLNNGSHPLETPVPDTLSSDLSPTLTSHSKSEFESHLVSSPLDAENFLSLDPRRDSMYSVRTSATAPVSFQSCPSSPMTNQKTIESSSIHYNLSDAKSEDNESFLKALLTFNQLPSELSDNINGASDFQQLREALHNFNINDQKEIGTLVEEKSHKNSPTTTFTGETSGSDQDGTPLSDSVVNDALVNSLLHSIAPSIHKHRRGAEPIINGKDGSILTNSPSISSPDTQNEPEESLNNESDSIMDDKSIAEDMVSDLASPSIMAKNLYENSISDIPCNEIAEYLGKRGPYYSQVLKAYMNYFSFSGLRLDEAFRNLCTHLYLHGETQVIDRILAEFARRYWDCNPGSVFRSQDVVYATSYSMLLLNTDLHVAKNHHKMSRSDFVKNTLAAIESCARAVSFELEGSGAGHKLDARSKSNENYGYSSINHDELTQTLKEMYNSIKGSQILQPVEPKSATQTRSSSYAPSTATSANSSLHRTRSATRLRQTPTMNKKNITWDLQRQRSGNSLNLSQMSTRSGTPDMYLNSPNITLSRPPSKNANVNPTEAALYPYQKVGTLIRKHLYERFDKKAAHRTWKDCLVVVERGDIKMYKSEKGKYGGDGLELMDVNLQLGNVSLRHCLAVTLPPPGYSSSRPHVFALQLPSGGVYLFQAASADLVAEWVVICNFWSARESKEPLPGGICSIDYGWGTSYDDKNEFDDDESLGARLPAVDSYQPVSSRQLFSEQQAVRSPPPIQEWRPPAPPMVRSALSEDDQLDALLKQIAALDAELVDHMELRGTIHRRMPAKSPHYAKAFSNWERKSQYLLRELIKYQTYADVLKKTLTANRGLSDPANLAEEDELEYVPYDDPIAPINTIAEIPSHNDDANSIDTPALTTSSRQPSESSGLPTDP